MVALSDEQLRGKTAEFKERLAKGETLDNCCPKPSPWPVRPASA
jgi:preprotein translocase subunit SecA